MGWIRGLGTPDGPGTLQLASDGRGFSYDSGDAVNGVESGKCTPLDLTSEETGGRGMLVGPVGGGCIVCEVVEANEKGGGGNTPPKTRAIYVPGECYARPQDSSLNQLKHVSQHGKA